MPSLELVREAKLDRLFHTSDKYEASDVTLLRDKLYLVCDSTTPTTDRRIPTTKPSLHARAPCLRCERPSRKRSTRTMPSLSCTMRPRCNASSPFPPSWSFKVCEALVRSLTTLIRLTSFCLVDTSKGLEGATSIRGSDGTLYLLGLCECNHCRKSDDKGNGRLVVMKRGKHRWETVKKLHIPETAFFCDYSAVDVDDEGHVLVVSQEESRLWMGQLLGRLANGTWDVEQLALDASVSRVWEFPRSEACEVVYCNVEGVHWMGPRMIVAVSDRSKKKQPERCRTKDQSIHVFQVPCSDSGLGNGTTLATSSELTLSTSLLFTTRPNHGGNQKRRGRRFRWGRGCGDRSRR